MCPTFSPAGLAVVRSLRYDYMSSDPATPMTLVTIRAREAAGDGPNATVSFDAGPEYAVRVTDPFSPAEEERLEWYFEEHLAFPFLDQVRAREAAESVRTYGEALVAQLFTDRSADSDYRTALQSGIDTLRFETAGPPDFQHLHWEALKDPDLPRAFALEAPMVRKNLRPQGIAAAVRASPTINILVVTARPDAERDVGYRTISRPAPAQASRWRRTHCASMVRLTRGLTGAASARGPSRLWGRGRRRRGRRTRGGRRRGSRRGAPGRPCGSGRTSSGTLSQESG